MKIGIISDTHYYDYSHYDIPEWIQKAFFSSDIIIHAGDVESPSVIRAYENIAPVYAVRGNCDPSELQTPQSISIDIGCGKLIAAHKPAFAKQEANDEPNAKVIVCGHTHISTISEYDGLIIINPGSPTNPRGGMPPSVAVLEVTDSGQFFPQIITKW